VHNPATPKAQSRAARSINPEYLKTKQEVDLMTSCKYKAIKNFFRTPDKKLSRLSILDKN